MSHNEISRVTKKSDQESDQESDQDMNKMGIQSQNNII